VSRNQADAADEWAANRRLRAAGTALCDPDGPASETTVAGNTAAIELSAKDLPAYCPNPNMPLWSTHPRVFLDVVNEQESMCPYCGTRYRLKRGAHVHDHEFGALNLHQNQDRVRGDAQANAHSQPLAPDRSDETATVAADRMGNTTLELITSWLAGRR
jgi:uncharacterized Zn-finger protein